MNADPGPPRRPRRATLWRRAATLGVLVVLLTVVVSSDALHGALLAVFDWARQVIVWRPALGAVVFVLLSALSAMVAFVSSAVLIPVALVVWDGPVVLVLLWLGWLVGGAAAYTVARSLGRHAMHRLLSPAVLERYETWVSPRTPAGLVLLFQLAMPSEIPGYVLGLARYPLLRYLVILSIGELPYAIGAVALGAGLLERRTGLLLAVGGAGVALSLLSLAVLQRHLARRSGPP
jgi:uncharacterized membrane protein YdjX (TVP38/TMEM64 family)